LGLFDGTLKKYLRAVYFNRMFRSLCRPVFRRCSFDQHVSDITKYYNKLREDERFSNPQHDYPKCVNKINFHIYRLIIDEYETNIKPRDNRLAMLNQISALFASKGIRLSFHEHDGFFGLVRETSSHIFTMRILSYLDDTLTQETAKEENDEPKTLMEKVKLARTIQYEHENLDERYYYKIGGKIVSPESLPVYQHLLKDKMNPKTLVNPFSLKTDEADIIDFVMEIASKRDSARVFATGFIGDL